MVDAGNFQGNGAHCNPFGQFLASPVSGLVPSSFLIASVSPMRHPHHELASYTPARWWVHSLRKDQVAPGCWGSVGTGGDESFSFNGQWAQ